jgi:RimJ/RimL family protein N-acetyltransferase
VETERLRLNPVTIDHVDVLHAIWTDAGVRRYLWDDLVIERDVAAQVVEANLRDWRERGYGLWLIELLESGEAIGFVGFRSSEEDERPELLYGLLPAYWHRGFATEASRAALSFLREKGIHAVRAATDPPNTASIGVMERLGMTFERRGQLNGLDTVFYRL